MFGAAVALPRSEFIDQGHISTICTRVQFALNQCLQGSVYGHARAFSPLLDESLEGPVYLRSSNNLVPDVVLDLHGLVDIEVSAWIDSVKGGIRATFAEVPDAPVSKVELVLFGGKKGLLVNSVNICKVKHRAQVKFDGQNGKQLNLRPVVKADCGEKHGRHKRHS